MGMLLNRHRERRVKSPNELAREAEEERRRERDEALATSYVVTPSPYVELVTTTLVFDEVEVNIESYPDGDPPDGSGLEDGDESEVDVLSEEDAELLLDELSLGGDQEVGDEPSEDDDVDPKPGAPTAQPGERKRRRRRR